MSDDEKNIPTSSSFDDDLTLPKATAEKLIKGGGDAGAWIWLTMCRDASARADGGQGDKGSAH